MAATEKDPHMALAHFQLGMVNYHLHRYNESRGSYDKARTCLRGNKFIDYRQLGFIHKLYECEVSSARVIQNWIMHVIQRHTQTCTHYKLSHSFACTHTHTHPNHTYTQTHTQIHMPQPHTHTHTHTHVYTCTQMILQNISRVKPICTQMILQYIIKPVTMLKTKNLNLVLTSTHDWFSRYFYILDS